MGIPTHEIHCWMNACQIARLHFISKQHWDSKSYSVNNEDQISSSSTQCSTRVELWNLHTHEWVVGRILCYRRVNKKCPDSLFRLFDWTHKFRMVQGILVRCLHRVCNVIDSLFNRCDVQQDAVGRRLIWSWLLQEVKRTMLKKYWSFSSIIEFWQFLQLQESIIVWMIAKLDQVNETAAQLFLSLHLTSIEDSVQTMKSTQRSNPIRVIDLCPFSTNGSKFFSRP